MNAAPYPRGAIGAGTLLLGRYRLEELLGQGAFGAVYSGVDENLRRRVAVKVLTYTSADPGSLAAARGRFSREAELLAELQHPGIVSVFDRGDHGEVPFIVMEHLPGPDLDTLRRGQGVLPVAEVVRLGVQTSDALGFAHTAARPVIHKDLKPKNLMLDRRGNVKILDFGLATSPGSDHLRYTRTGQMLGTPLYASPEQLGTGAVTERTDIYALGAVLYELLTGEPPLLPTGHLGAFPYQVQHQQPEPLRGRRQDVPAALAELVHRMLAKQPEDRPDAAEVHRRLSGLEVSQTTDLPVLDTDSFYLPPPAPQVPPPHPVEEERQRPPASDLGSPGSPGSPAALGRWAWGELEQAERRLTERRFEPAANAFGGVLARMQDEGQAGHPAALAAEFGLVRVSSGQGRYAEAERLRASLVARATRELGAGHPLTRALLGFAA
jgi:serine/threonine protein kinase